jgi:ribose transport system substrate-binding protein
MKGAKKILSLAVAASIFAVAFAGCGSSQTASNTADSSPSSTAAENTASDTGSSKPYIAVVSKGFQHQYWQTVKKGAEEAATKYNVEMTFDGPPSESDVNVQVDMINAAIAKKPAALALAVLDTSSVTQQLNGCKSNKIPIIGFDSGIPNAPEGTLLATASTNNENAGALAADSMFADTNFQAALKAATTDNPVTIGVQSQDATSASILGRTNGFINEMFKKCETLFAGKVAVTGHEKFKKDASSGKAAVNIYVVVPPSSNATDSQNASQSLLNTKGIIAVYASNEASVNGILAATTDGKDLDRSNGKYKNITVVGFDAGKAQKAAVRNGWFLGSVTQDPYKIGYLAVELAAKAIKGESVSDTDTGCKFYTAKNMDESDIAILLYD